MGGRRSTMWHPVRRRTASSFLLSLNVLCSESKTRSIFELGLNFLLIFQPKLQEINLMNFVRNKHVCIVSHIISSVYVCTACTSRLTPPFGARGRSSVRYGTRLGDLKNKHSTHTHPHRPRLTNTVFQKTVFQHFLLLSKDGVPTPSFEKDGVPTPSFERPLPAC